MLKTGSVERIGNRVRIESGVKTGTEVGIGVEVK